MAPVSGTRVYNARLTALLDKIRPVLQNNISTSTPFYFKYKKSGNWKEVTELGDRYRVPLMYEFAPVGTFGANGVGTVDITPVDGQTPAFYDWVRLASSITIGDFEKAQNKGAAIDLLKSKTTQAMTGLEDRFGRWLLQGHGAVDGSSITTARTDTNGSAFLMPIPLLIKYDPTTSTTIGDINQSTESWWQNQKIASSASTFAGQLAEVDHLVNLCSKGAGGQPDLFVADLLGYEQVAKALRAQVRFTEYQEVDLPFKAINVAGSPLVFDQFVPDAKNGSTTVASGAYSTIYALNSKFAGIAVWSGANFTPGDFVRAPNGAGESALIQWYGTHWCSRRDKHGVIGGFNNSVVS